MNYVIAARIPNNLTLTKLLSTGPSIYTIVADGNYNSIFNPAFIADYIKSPSMSNVLLLSVDGIQYTSVDTYEELYANPKTFLWTFATGRLDIHTPNTINIWKIKSIAVGVSLAFYKTNMSHKAWNGIYNGVKYWNTLKKTPSFSDEFNDFFDQQMKYPESSVSIENTDGIFSRLNEDDNYINRNILIESWFSENGTDVALAQEFMGIINNISVGTEIEISFRDSRDRLKEKTPFRELDLSIFTNCEDNYVIPEIWGTVRRYPLKCINENDSGTKWQFMIADTTYFDIHELTAVYNNGVSIGAVPTILYLDNVAYIEILKSAISGNGDITATISGYEDPDTFELIENPLDIIRNKLYLIYGHEYNSVYYNTTAWEMALPLAYKIGIPFDEKQELKEQIETICSSSGGFFEIEKTTDLYSFIMINDDLSTQLTIYEKQFCPSDDTNIIDYDVRKMITIGAVGYSKRFDNDTYSVATDDSRSIELSSLLNSESILKQIDTHISNSLDAERAAILLLDLYGKKLRKISKRIFIDSANRLLRAGQYVGIEFNRNGFNMGTRRGFLLKVNKNYDNMMIDLEMYLEEEDESGYLVFIDDDGVIDDAEITDDTGTYDYYVI